MTAFWRTKTEGPQENTELREVQFTINDMTLRDYFAAKAMQSIVLSILSEGTKTNYDLEKSEFLECVALDAYAHADAMIKVRKANQ